MLIHPKATNNQIGEAVGVSGKTICAWRKDPDFQIEYNLQLKAKWKDAAGVAVDTMIALAEEGSFQAAKYILDCNGFAENGKDPAGMPNTINIIIE